MTERKRMTVTVSEANTLTREDFKAWIRNVAIFSIPALIIFLEQLQSGVALKEAISIALYAVLAAVIDLLKKYRSEKVRL